MRLSTVSDEDLLSAFAKGDQAALAELAHRYEAKVLGLASGLLGWRSDLACDAVQEAWIRVIRFAGKFNGRSSFKTWLYRIVINQCRNVQAAQPPADAERPATETGVNPGQAVEAAEARDALKAAVLTLSAEKQAVLLLCYHEGMAHAQAAEILDVPLGTLKSRLHSALEELRDRLSPEVKP